MPKKVGLYRVQELPSQTSGLLQGGFGHFQTRAETGSLLFKGVLVPPSSHGGAATPKGSSCSQIREAGQGEPSQESAGQISSLAQTRVSAMTLDTSLHQVSTSN